MDILAAMLAYLVSVAGIVAALGIACFTLFSTPNQQAAMPTDTARAALVIVRSGAIETATADANPEAKIQQIDKPAISGAATVAGNPVTTIAVDARQKPPHSAAALRRLAVKERAKRLAFREGADFETRFLRYED
jgi:hypothetical protein